MNDIFLLFQADPKLKYIQESPILDSDHFLTFRIQFRAVPKLRKWKKVWNFVSVSS